MRSRRHLPHLRQDGVIYYVTFRLADSAPQERLRQWHAAQEAAQRHGVDAETTKNQVQRQIELWLDRGVGDCVLENPKAAQVVADALGYFDSERYLLDEFVIMPNHVHALLQPLDGHELSDILRSWKRFSAREINKLQAASGALWQSESFDHIVRDTQSLARFRQYIRRNPTMLRGRFALLGKGGFGDRTGI